MTPPPNPLIAALTGQWNSLKGRFRNSITKLETYFKVVLFLVIFTLLVTTGYQYRKVQVITKEVTLFKDSVRIVDEVRELKLQAINKRVLEMEELSIATQKENLRLQQELNQLQMNKKNAMKEIDKYSSEDLANWFKGKSLKPQKK